MTATARRATGRRSVRTTQGYASSRGRGRQLRLRRRLRRRVPRVPLQLQRGGFRAARHGGSRQARPPRRQRARRRRDGRPGRARGAGRDRRDPQRARPVPRSPLGRGLPRRRRGARVLAEEARLPRGLARPPGQGREARGWLRRGGCRLLLPRPPRRPRAARAAADAELARAPVPPMNVRRLDGARQGAEVPALPVPERDRTPRWYALAGPGYLAALLAVD